MVRAVVIIPTFKDWQRLQLCLDALAVQTFPADQFEIIVANNDPSDPAPPFTLRDNVRVITEAQPGSYAARNAAVNASTAEILAFTDSDCVPDPDWLQSAIALIDKTPEARVSGQVPIFHTAHGSTAAFVYEFHTAFRQREYAMRGEGATANLVVRRETFLKVGMFDDRLMSGGDFEWHRRARAAGVPIVYADNVIVRHPSRSTLAEIFRKRRRTARSEAKFHATSTWEYLKYRIKPPTGRVPFDRGQPSPRDRAILFTTMYAINLYAVYNFGMVRLGLAKATRS